jgi:CRISPR-associated protein (TIGR02584 family)
MSSGDVYLMAPLGLSPAIVTEALWWLVVREQRRVVGVELWVTKADDGGRAATDTLWDWVKERKEGKTPWQRLRDAAGEHQTLLPELPERLPVRHREPDSALSESLTVFAFEHGDVSLSDNRGAGEAEAIGRQLHARVRHLCATLGDTVLVGSIAGGRKNFGSTLQGAFELHARVTDRLVHVLVHPSIEASAARSGFVVPEPGWGVPLDQQVTVFDVPFPPMRALFPEASAVFDDEDPITLWSQFRRNFIDAEQVTAVMSKSERRWCLQFFVGGEPRWTYRFATAGSAEVYAAIVAGPCVSQGRKRRLTDWSNYILKHPLGRQRDSEVGPDDDALGKRIRKLAAEMSALRLRGLLPFAVEGEMEGAHVPAANRVTLPSSPSFRRTESGGQFGPTD